MSLSFRLVIVSAVMALAAVASAGSAMATCPKEISAAVKAARVALSKSDGVAEATECLIEAVDLLDQKLSELISGKIVFEGPVTAKGGFLNQGESHPTEEGR